MLDPLDFLHDLDIIVAWTQTMPWQALWLPNERVVVLNAEQSRSALAGETLALVRPGHVSPWSPS